MMMNTKDFQLANDMWYSLTIGDTAYGIKVCRPQEGGYNAKWTVMLCDMVHIWMEDLTHEVFFERSKELNPTLEFSQYSTDYLLATTMIKLFAMASPEHRAEEDNIYIFDSVDDDDIKILGLERSFGGVPFKFEFLFKLVKDSMMMHDSVTVPLLTLSYDLERKQRLLIDIIKEKDVEINEYKMLGAQLQRKNVVTKPFDEEHFFKETANFAVLNNAQEVATLMKTSLLKPVDWKEQIFCLPPVTRNDSPGNSSGGRAVYEDDLGIELPVGDEDRWSEADVKVETSPETEVQLETLDYFFGNKPPGRVVKTKKKRKLNL